MGTPDAGCRSSWGTVLKRGSRRKAARTSRVSSSRILPYLSPRSAASNNKDKGRTPKRQRSTTPPHRRDKTISLSALQTLVAAADDDEQLPTHAPPACAQGHKPVTAAEEPTPAARGRAT